MCLAPYLLQVRRWSDFGSPDSTKPIGQVTTLSHVYNTQTSRVEVMSLESVQNSDRVEGMLRLKLQVLSPKMSCLASPELSQVITNKFLSLKDWPQGQGIRESTAHFIFVINMFCKDSSSVLRILCLSKSRIDS